MTNESNFKEYFNQRIYYSKYNQNIKENFADNKCSTQESKFAFSCKKKNI